MTDTLSPALPQPPKASGGGTSGAPAQPAPAYQTPAPQRAPVTGKPSWAQ